MTISTITSSCADEALAEGLCVFRYRDCTREDSRNGPVIVAPGPVVTTHTNPARRVMYNPGRDANPAFHLIEAMWMLGGGRRAHIPALFNARFKEYAEEDTDVVHGAYGWRWRCHFGYDQIESIITELREKPASRQAVLAMWDPMADMRANKRDIPCNTHIYFDLRGGVLNMTVCCRSNDMLWGAFGANLVHMSMLQELIASAVGAPMGVYRQFSNNFHAYVNLPQFQFLMENSHRFYFPYLEIPGWTVFPMIAHGEDYKMFLQDCGRLGLGDYKTTFFRNVVEPIYSAFLTRKTSKLLTSVEPNCDWAIAFNQWVERRHAKD